nr:hypothetical protein Iba_chr14dCG3940 [Ipomoea batatas]
MLDCCTEVENGNGCDYAGRLVVVGCESVTRLADCVAGRNRESVTKRVARMEKQQNGVSRRPSSSSPPAVTSVPAMVAIAAMKKLDMQSNRASGVEFHSMEHEHPPSSYPSCQPLSYEPLKSNPLRKLSFCDGPMLPFSLCSLRFSSVFVSHIVKFSPFPEFLLQVLQSPSLIPSPSIRPLSLKIQDSPFSPTYPRQELPIFGSLTSWRTQIRGKSSDSGVTESS